MTLILHFFQWILEGIDRGIYAVDEWLRFREGEGRASFVSKLLFGVLWFGVTYLFRFAWTLMVEPQINPIKHFPVVTVSHKLLLPLIPSLAKQFHMTDKTMGTIVFGIPGIFGFLVWELRENWKLYQSNAARDLQSAAVGSHGEKVRALLRPGFHSGVVPKTLAKLRHAVRKGKTERASRLHHSLDHIAEAVSRFFDREFITYLRSSSRWGGVPIQARKPILTPNEVLLPIVLGDTGAATSIVLEERGGWVIASFRGGSAIESLSGSAQAAFTDALAGLYKRAGVNVIREQVAAEYGSQSLQFDADSEGLFIPTREGAMQFFSYKNGFELQTPERILPSQVVFSDCPLAWARWVERWEADSAGKNPVDPLLPGWTLLTNRDAA